jgi:hypothetical protein
MTDSERSFELLLEEYKHLKEEVSVLDEKMGTVLQYVLGSSAALYAWAFAHHSALSALIPIGLSLAGAVLTIEMYWRRQSIRRWLLSFERSVNTVATTGWEDWREQDTTTICKTPHKTKDVLQRTLLGLWVVIILVTFVVALAYNILAPH